MNMRETGEIHCHGTERREGTDLRTYDYPHMTVVHSTATHHTVFALRKVQLSTTGAKWKKRNDNPNEGLHAHCTR